MILPLIFTVIIVVTIWLLVRRRTQELEERNKRLAALRKLDEIMMSSSTNLEEVAKKVTDAIAFILGFEIGVLALVDEKRKMLRRVAMSSTVTGVRARQSLPFPYEELDIPLNFTQNLAVQAIRDNQKKMTHRLYDLFMPTLDEKISLEIQQTVKVKTSYVYPIRSKEKVIGVMIFSIARSENELSSYEKESMENLVDVVGIVLENARLYQNLQETSNKLSFANQKLQELDKLKDDFVSVASHELRTPMTAIRAYAWMALNKPDIELSEKMKKYLSRTLISTERLINLVNDMLNVSRIESGRIEIKPEVFNLIHLVSEVIDEVSPKAQENGLKLLMLESKIPEVFADSDKVHQVLLNLVGNSLKFTPTGGQIIISFFTDGKVVETSVKDTGAGISKEDLGQLFQKFGRLDSSYVAMGTSGGTGLGLFISKKLVELMAGKIWVSSEGLNKGTTFSFSLPIEKYQVQPVKGETKSLEPVAI